MRQHRVAFAVTAFVGVCLASGDASAQARDHLECYHVKDPLNISAVVDVQTRFLGVPNAYEQGCKLKKAVYYCEPATKTVVSSNRPPEDVVGRGLLDSRICYKLQCPREAYATFTGIHDQFGVHGTRVAHGKYLCVPAVHGPPSVPMDDLDDLKCYRATETTAALSAVVNLDGLNLGSKAGCKATRSKFFCTAAHTLTRSDNIGGAFLPIGGDIPDDERVCYTLTCPRPFPFPQIVSDRFGSRTMTGLTPRVLCTSGGTALLTTTTTATTTSVTSTTFPPGTDQGIVCQRSMENFGLAYENLLLDGYQNCAAPGGTNTMSACSINTTSLVSQWKTVANLDCAGVPLHSQLGYGTCGRCGSNNTDTPSALVDCLACRLSTAIQDAVVLQYGDREPSNTCHATLGNGGLQLMRTAFQHMHDCVQADGATSVAACYAFDPSTWQSQAQTACAGVDPYTLGYENFRYCNRSGVGTVFPGFCASDAPPCTMYHATLSQGGADNDLLDCLSCQAVQGITETSAALYGAELCCIGGTCNKVLTRVACYQAGGHPARYRIDSLPVASGGAHGIDVGPDGNLYMTFAPGNGITRVALPSGTQTTVTTGMSGFLTGVAADAAGNVYIATRCGHVITKVDSHGVRTPFAGTGTAGSTGDGGPAVAAQIAAPDSVAVDPAGNVYFPESGFMAGGLCGSLVGGDEKVRMVDTNGIIHTVAGGGSAPPGGPALGTGMLIPYGLRRAPNGTIIVGEAGWQRVLGFTVGGTMSLIAGEQLGAQGDHRGYGGPASNAHFYQNCGVAGDPDGNVVIAPMEDNRIALVDTLGSVIGIAGTGRGSFNGSPDGDGGYALVAQAGCPEDIAVGPDGKIYFSDLQSQRIRVLTRELY